MYNSRFLFSVVATHCLRIPRGTLGRPSCQEDLLGLLRAMLGPVSRSPQHAATCHKVNSWNSNLLKIEHIKYLTYIQLIYLFLNCIADLNKPEINYQDALYMCNALLTFSSVPGFQAEVCNIKHQMLKQLITFSWVM